MLATVNITIEHFGINYECIINSYYLVIYYLREINNGIYI